MEDDALATRLKALVGQDSHLTSLVEDGYAIIDNAFQEDHAKALRQEIIDLESQNFFEPNKVQFNLPGRNEPIIATKPGVFEIDLHDQNKRSAAPHFARLFHGEAFSSSLQPVEEALAIKSNSQKTPVRLQAGPNGKTIKLQINRGGAFPIHYDNPGRPNKRRWTCLLYLNPGWTKGDGGEVVLVPFGQPGTGVTVEPLFNRLLVFRSDLLLHRVLTASKKRFCFTVWQDAVVDDINVDADVFLKQKHLSLDVEEFIALMKRSPLQRTISRAVYAEVYEDSLLMCFNGNKKALSSDIACLDEGSRYMLAAHRAQTKALMKNGALSGLLQKLRQYITRPVKDDEGTKDAATVERTPSQTTSTATN